MDLAFPICDTERREARSLEIIIEFLGRLGIGLTALQLMRGRERDRWCVGLQSAAAKSR
jgi:hypothetical protein